MSSSAGTVTTMRCTMLVVVVLAAAALPAICSAQLNIGFYNKTCPSAEMLVQQAVAQAFANNSGVAPGLIRMHFHDCFVRGCDASVLLDSTPGNSAEKDAPPNFPSLRGFEVVDAAKTALEAQCPGIVSCADILAFAARDAASLAGNITYRVPAGRRDGNVSIFNEALTNLPGPSFNASQLVDNFARKNLTPAEMVILSGAHTIGIAHCDTFTDRLYNLTTGAPLTDPTLSAAYAALLRNTCPASSNQTTPITVELDLITPNALDNMYYVGVQLNLGLLTSDAALMTDANMTAQVKNYADHPNGWATDFKRAMVKMGGIEVLTGTQGEIRRNCHVVNSRTSFESVVGPDDLPGVASS